MIYNVTKPIVSCTIGLVCRSIYFGFSKDDEITKYVQQKTQKLLLRQLFLTLKDRAPIRTFSDWGGGERH